MKRVEFIFLLITLSITPINIFSSRYNSYLTKEYHIIFKEKFGNKVSITNDLFMSFYKNNILTKETNLVSGYYSSFEYNTKKKLIKRVSNYNNGIVEIYVYKYNKESNLVEKNVYENYIDDMYLIRKTKYFYKDNLLKYEKMYNSFGEIIDDVEYFYDKRDRIIRKNIFKNGKLQYINKLIYSKSGKLVKEKVSFNGDVISYLKRKMYKEVHYHYYKNGKLKEIINLENNSINKFDMKENYRVIFKYEKIGGDIK